MKSTYPPYRPSYPRIPFPYTSRERNGEVGIKANGATTRRSALSDKKLEMGFTLTPALCGG